MPLELRGRRGEMLVSLTEQRNIGVPWKIVENHFKNFDLRRYYDLVNRKELPADLMSLLIEAEVAREDVTTQASQRVMVWIPDRGFFHKVGEDWISYTDFFRRSVSDSSGLARERFGAELLGWQRAEEQFQSDEVEIVVLASPPGETYRFQDKEPLSATFIIVKTGVKRVVIDGEEVDGIECEAFSLYRDEMSVKEHVEILSEVGEWVKQMDKVDALSLVSTPVVLAKIRERLDRLVMSLGFESWESMEGMALRLGSLFFEKETERDYRRQRLIELLVEVVDLSLSENNEWELDKVEKAIEMSISREAFGYYVGYSQEEIRKDIQLTLLTLHLGGGGKLFDALRELDIDSRRYYDWKQKQEELLRDEVFQRMMSMHGGGGVVVKDSFGVMQRLDRPLLDKRFDWWRRQQDKKQEKHRVRCSHCGYSFETSESSCDCPKCKRRIENRLLEGV